LLSPTFCCTGNELDAADLADPLAGQRHRRALPQAEADGTSVAIS
jgi:hypothetical protein